MLSFVWLPFSFSFNALYAFFNKGISSEDVFSAIQETEDIKELVESVGEGGPGGARSVSALTSKRLGGANFDNILKMKRVKKKAREKKTTITITISQGLGRKSYITQNSKHTGQ